MSDFWPKLMIFSHQGPWCSHPQALQQEETYQGLDECWGGIQRCCESWRGGEGLENQRPVRSHPVSRIIIERNGRGCWSRKKFYPTHLTLDWHWQSGSRWQQYAKHCWQRGWLRWFEHEDIEVSAPKAFWAHTYVLHWSSIDTKLIHLEKNLILLWQKVVYMLSEFSFELQKYSFKIFSATFVHRRNTFLQT